MKIRNISHLDLVIDPRGDLPVEERPMVTVKAGAVIDLEPYVAGVPPTPDYLAANAAIGTMSPEDPRCGELLAVLRESANKGFGFLAQFDVWQLVEDAKPKSRKAASQEGEA